MWGLAQLVLPGLHRPDQGERSGRQPSSCESCGPSSREAQGVLSVGKAVNWSPFLKDGSLGGVHNDQTVVSPKVLVTQTSSFDILVGRGHFVCNP